MKDSQESWLETVVEYLSIDSILHIFPAPRGKKFNSSLDDCYSWATSTSKLKKEILL